MNTTDLDRNPTKQPHPTVKGAHIYMVEQLTNRERKSRIHREAVLKYPDGGWIKVQGERKTGWLGVSSFYCKKERRGDLLAMYDEMAAWVDGDGAELEEAA